MILDLDDGSANWVTSQFLLLLGFSGRVNDDFARVRAHPDQITGEAGLLVAETLDELNGGDARLHEVERGDLLERGGRGRRRLAEDCDMCRHAVVRADPEVALVTAPSPRRPGILRDVVAAATYLRYRIDFLVLPMRNMELNIMSSD